MSLIQAALEKSMQSIKEKRRMKPNPPSFNQSSAPLISAPKPKEPVIPLAAARKKTNPLPGFLFLVFSAALAGSLFYMMTHRGKKPAMELAVSSAAMTSSPAMQVVKSFIPEKKYDEILPRYVLSGITMVEGERLALINNQIVRAGDILSGNAVVKEILSKSVILSARNKEVRLSI